MSTMSRRDFVEGIAAGAAVAAVLATQEVGAQAAAIPGAFGAEHQPRPLPFAAGSMEGLSEQLIDSHWQNNYGGSVTALNTVKTRLVEALADDAMPAYVYNGFKREHLLRTGSVVLHELYFDNLAPPGARDSELDAALTSAYGSVATWEREFRRIAAGLGGGSGWVMLGWNTHNRTLENYWMWDHMHAPAAVQPLLVMDMYEHSYQMDFGAAAAQYIDAFMRNVNWGEVNRRLGATVQG
jgi:Fe-Mn family superoxide dismutase